MGTTETAQDAETEKRVSNGPGSASEPGEGPMHRVLIAESTNRLLGELAMPGESKGDALRRVLGGAESWRCPPSPGWLARTVAV